VVRGCGAVITSLRPLTRELREGTTARRELLGSLSCVRRHPYESSGARRRVTVTNAPPEGWLSTLMVAC
jgi:hypothetical protein